MNLVRVFFHWKHQTLLISTLVAFGSWADEMDMVPTRCKRSTVLLLRVSAQLMYYAASGTSDEPRSRLSDAPDRGSRDLRCQFFCTNPTDRILTSHGPVAADRPPREDLPLPTSPPYTAFIGNLAFDVTESQMAAFFDGYEVRHELMLNSSMGLFTQLLSRRSQSKSLRTEKTGPRDSGTLNLLL